jgi:uncharacterized protein YjeT (DUF2065 family)
MNKYLTFFALILFVHSIYRFFQIKKKIPKNVYPFFIVWNFLWQVMFLSIVATMIFKSRVFMLSANIVPICMGLMMFVWPGQLNEMLKTDPMMRDTELSLLRFAGAVFVIVGGLLFLLFNFT